MVAPVPLSFARRDERAATARMFADGLRDGYLERARRTEFFWDLYREAGERGYLAMSLVTDDGTPARAVEAGIVLEEIAEADFNVAFSIFGALCTLQLIDEHASADVRAAWLPDLIAGERLIGLALTEPEAGSDARGITTRARRRNGGWVLDGRKTSSGMAAIAQGSIVFARTGDGPADISAFLVPLDAPGVQRERIEARGFRPTGRGRIDLDEVLIPDNHLVGQVGGGFDLFSTAFDYTRSLLGLMCVGTSRAALRMTIDWT